MVDRNFGGVSHLVHERSLLCVWSDIGIFLYLLEVYVGHSFKCFVRLFIASMTRSEILSTFLGNI